MFVPARRRVRRLVIGLLVLLPLQYAVVGLVGVRDAEPWPALVLPGFKRVMDDGQRHTVRHVACHVRFEDGTATDVPAATLLDALPRSYHAAFFRTYAAPGTDPPPALVAWLRDQLDGLYPDRTATQLGLIWEELVYEFARDEGHARATAVDSLVLALR